MNVGDKALVFLPMSHKKLLMQWSGPYKVIERLGPYTYLLDINGCHRRYHINLLKKYQERPTAEQPCKEDDPHPPDDAPIVNEVLAAVAVALEEPTEVLDQHDLGIPATSQQTWKDCVISPHLQQEQHQQLINLLQKHQDILTDVPGRTATTEHHINIDKKEQLRLNHTYPLPYALEPQLKNDLQTWQQQGIVVPSRSPYCSPLLAVRKKDGTHRFCLDCRQLNLQTTFDSEPIEDPEAIFTKLAPAQYLSKIDLTAGYWQVPLSQASRELTAFKTRSGLYEFQVMPFGLSTAPATFSRLVRQVTRGLHNTHAYLDDLLVATTTWEEHLTALDELLTALKKHGLHAKPTKCEFGCERLQYLGHYVGQGETRPLHDRTDKIKETSLPQNKTQLRSFLGAMNYYSRFLKDFQHQAKPLYQKLAKKEPDRIQWDAEAQDLFDTLRKALTMSPILQLPDTQKTFVLRTDASNTGIGAVLLQENQRDHRLLSPVAYASRSLKAAELNYATIEKEALSIYWAVQKFSIYLYGRRFKLQTDHKPLLYLQTADRLNPRLKRWAIYLCLYTFTCTHIAGEDNNLADYLSRLPHTPVPQSRDFPMGVSDSEATIKT